MVVPWLWRLIASLSPQVPEFDPRPVRVTFMVGRGALGQVFLRLIRFFPVSVIPPVHHTHIFHHYTIHIYSTSTPYTYIPPLHHTHIFHQYTIHIYSTSTPYTYIPPLHHTHIFHQYTIHIYSTSTPYTYIPPVHHTHIFHQYTIHIYSTSTPYTYIPPLHHTHIFHQYTIHIYSTSTPYTYIPPVHHTHIRLRVALTRRKNGKILGTFQKLCSYEIGEHWTGKYFHFLSLTRCYSDYKNKGAKPGNLRKSENVG